METPFELIKQCEQDYISGTSQLSEYVSFSLKENVDKIEAYLYSKFTSGDTDSLGREKPFFNIVTANANVWYRATDIDRANIRIKGTNSSQHTISMLANVKSKEWMRKARFGTFLNEWGRTLARYGSAVVKFVEVDGELKASVVPWNRLILDNVEFEGNPVIEKHYYTHAQLRANKNFDQDVVEQLIAVKQTRKTLGGNQKDSIDDYIEVYELHGEFVDSWITGEEYPETEKEKYSQQVHIISTVLDKEDKEIDFCLYKGREKNPYMMTHLIKEDGRIMGIGAVEHLFEAQWMVNHNEKAIKDQLDLASKLVFQTSDPAYQSKNIHALETGSILYHEPNQPLTQVANNGHDAATIINNVQRWKMNGNEQVSAPDAIKGNNMPSGTAARQVEALQQESHSLFELFTENKGLALEEMWRRFVIPYLKKQLDTKDEIVATLDDANIKQIDAIYVPNVAKKRIAEKFKKQMFDALRKPINEAPGTIDQPDMATELSNVQNEMQALGNQRYFAPDELDEKTWKESFKDLEWDVEVEVTSEAHDKQATLTTLTTVFREIAGMGDIKTAQTVLNKILEETGVFSPMELVTTMTAPQPMSSQMSPEQLPTQTADSTSTQSPVTQT